MTWGTKHSLMERLRTESGSALLLVVVAGIALLWANSPFSEAYHHLWETDLAISLGDLSLSLSLHHWVNDGLMILFFFVIGLEVRQELAIGALKERNRAWVPLAAGFAGVVTPALIYLAIAGRDAPAGWGAVVGTDTAFLLGALALVGPSMSQQLRIFLLALTVVDDFLAVTIIGVVYTDNLRLVPLAIALVALVALWYLGRTSQWRSIPYIVLVVIIWLATLESGVHPSLAGMVAGLLIPARATERGHVEDAGTLFRDYTQSPDPSVARTATQGVRRSISVNQRLHEGFRAPVSLIVVPIFALANAGVDLRGGILSDALGSSVTWGVVCGLVIGKLVGISFGAWVAIKAGWGTLPDGVGPGSVLGGAALSGMGFTVSLLVVGLALEGRAATEASVGIMLAMVLAALVGWAIFAGARRWLGETTADLPTQLDPPVDPSYDHIRGPHDAQFTLVEYMDFECPFCARATGMWRDLRGHFGDRIRYVVRHLPLDDVHPHARAAAICAEAAAEQGKFWEMHDALFADQEHLEAADLEARAQEIGLDLDQYRRDIADPRLAERVQDEVDSAHRSGARGTPTFYVCDTRHIGPHDARTLIAAIEEWEPEEALRRRS